MELVSEEPVVVSEALALQELTAAYLQSVGAYCARRVTLVSEEWEEQQHPLGTVYVKRWYLDILPEDNPVPGKN